jgi:hypothetical protein
MWSEQLSGGLADQRANDLRRAATRRDVGEPRRPGPLARLRGRLRRRPASNDLPDMVLDRVTIRRSRAADRDALHRLAQLDSRRLADGDLLVAEVDGELRAALPLAGGSPIADPFRPTAPLVSLLGLRATQIRDAGAARDRAPGAAAPLYVPRAW